MLHTTVSQPQEFKLSVNLRSPRRIADVVNRAWDFYDYLHKQDRPSGTAYAEIDDDSPDQILYAAMPAAELPRLLLDLGRREGLALIAFDKTNLPKEALPFVLSPAEAKGLDFHSVCVVNGGSLLRRIVDDREAFLEPCGGRYTRQTAGDRSASSGAFAAHRAAALGGYFARRRHREGSQPFASFTRRNRASSDDRGGAAHLPR